MSRNILSSAEQYLADTTEIRQAHLVRLDIPTTDIEGNPSITPFYLTDYLGDIVYNNKTYQAGKITKVGDVRQSQGLKNYKLAIDVAGEFPEELARGLVENLEFSYVGKEVEVLRAYITPEGSIVPFDKDSGGPLQLFIGDITDINITEGVTSGTSKVTWACAGKFADFDKINGRVTEDSSHRGLVIDGSGNEVPSDGAKRVEYQTDTGFQHAAQTINLITSYTATETRYKMKKRKFFWQSPKLVEYEEEVEKTLELGVDLSAQFIPKVYGVRKVPGIPVFIDALKSDPSQVYVVYAFSEGEVDAFLDLYIDGEPLICNSSLDRSKMICLGNQADGDTLSAFMDNSSAQEIQDLRLEFLGTLKDFEPVIAPIDPSSAVDRTIGSTHTKDPITGDEVINHFTVINSTGTKEIWIHHGLSNQNANEALVSIAASGDFLNQERWTSQDVSRVSSQYWDSNSKLLDTAYIVMHFSINSEETAIPEIEAVISGSLVDTYDAQGVVTPKQYTLNPVWHLLDYITTSRYGGELDVATHINIESFASVAAELDVVTSTYQDNFLTYWRYVGWKIKPGEFGSSTQRTLMQCNTLLNTENTVTKNTQGLLEQFDGTLNILGGKYHLSIENDDPIQAAIHISEVIGSVKTADLSTKNKYNSIQAAIVDPGLNWNSTQISFFNSDYLAKDNGIHKKGNIGFSHITNYYTAREWAERQLKKSRYSRQITITTYHKYLSLYPNANVTFEYERFWPSPKKFRVVSTTLHSDSKITLVLEDFDSDIYESSNSPDNSGESDSGISVVLPPTNLTYVALPNPSYSLSITEGVQGILVWDDPIEAQSIERFDALIMTGDVVQTDYAIPPNQTILEDNDPTKQKYYQPITGLLNNTSYTFKVRTISPSGKGSKFITTGLNTTEVPNPIKLTAPTEFKVVNSSTPYQFTGPDLILGWVESPNASLAGYQLEVMDSNGVLLRTEHLSTINTFTYSLALNKLDFNTINGSTGANRTLTARIRATNGPNPSSPSFISSDWVYL